MALRVANIRSVIAGNKRKLADFQRALKAIRQIKIRETQRAGRIVAKRLGHRFKFERYANESGQVVTVKPYGKAWGARKAQLKLDDRRGHARLGIQKQMDSPMIFVPRSDGFEIDIKRPALWVTGNARSRLKRKTVLTANAAKGGYKHRLQKGKKESFFVNAYIDHFANMKAPGLGLLANEDATYCEEQAQAKIREHLAGVSDASKRFLRGSAAAVAFKVDLRRLTA